MVSSGLQQCNPLRHQKVWFLLVFVFAFWNAKGQTYVGGTLASNTTYSPANNPYLVTEPLIVPSAITLTLEPGTEIRFMDGVSLEVKGTLIAQGTQTDSIYFLSDNIGTSTPWKGLVLHNTKTQVDNNNNYLSGSIISFAAVKNASAGITLQDSCSVLIEYSTIESCSWGLYVHEAKQSMVKNCTVKNCKFGIFIPTTAKVKENKFLNCSFFKNIQVGFFISNTSGNTQNNIISYNDFLENRIGLHIGNGDIREIGKNQIIFNTIKNSIEDGIRVYQDSTLIANNYISGNYNGVNLFSCENTTISHNSIQNNTGYGCVLTSGASSNVISQNTFSLNSGGVRIVSTQVARPSAGNTIVYNTFYNNRGISVEFLSFASATVHFNNILNNGAENSFRNFTTADIHAENNFWGTVQEPKIDSIIFDRFDDDEYGIVIYKEPSDTLIGSAPILPPKSAIKRMRGPNTLVQWEKSISSSAIGYRIYYGYLPNGQFSKVEDVGDTTQFLIPTPVGDSIAVTAYNDKADGINDQLDGYESFYTYAKENISAGIDMQVCSNEAVPLNQAILLEGVNPVWSTSGNGIFSNTHAAVTTYYLGEKDKKDNIVSLYLEATVNGQKQKDSIKLYVHHFPSLATVHDTTILKAASIPLSFVAASNHQSVLWGTLGDGTFSDTLSLESIYFFGQQDSIQGFVKIYITLESYCGKLTDTIYIKLVEGFTLSGKIWEKENPSIEATIRVFRKIPSGDIVETESLYTNANGLFEYSSIFPGEYFLYVIPPEDKAVDFAPTYDYNKTKWQDAYIYDLKKYSNYHDIDIHLLSTNANQLPPNGIASISGNTAPYTKGQIIVMLYDDLRNVLYKWTDVDENGNFIFDHLPFGDFVLVTEKVNHESIFSEIISLTPENSTITNVVLSKKKSGLVFLFQQRVPENRFVVYPNPFTTECTVSGFGTKGNYEIRIYNFVGKQIYHERFALVADEFYSRKIDFSNSTSGVYLVELRQNGTTLYKKKIIHVSDRK